MKLLLILAAALSMTAMPLLAADDDSTLKKAGKVKVYKEADNDSTVKKAVGIKATGEILSDDEDSTLMKATKVKTLDKARSKDD